ncbi:MAG: hypothetical protein KME16_21125 [Scytolyngbya sp. HA4215-MV1]|jgi:hypothetical protein|nr:hypothetical protein [Scytolyngbya sp. HA4215-MV1]
MYANQYRVDAEYESKLKQVQQKTEQKEIKAVIEAAIDAYYHQLEAPPNHQLEAPRKTALEIFIESGFIGCLQADADLSANYKEELSITEDVSGISRTSARLDS